MMKLNYTVLLLLVQLCAVSCSSNEQQEVSSGIDELQLQDTTLELCTDPDFLKEQAQREHLSSVLSSEIDLPKMKKEIGFLSMGWSIDSKYLPEVPEGSQQYNYGAVGGLILKLDIDITPNARELKNNQEKFISIITHKPWSTAEEKYYSSNNETMIGFESKVKYERLDSLNFVGSNEIEIEALFGSPDKTENECFAYKEDGKVLVLHFENETVDWMKFYTLNQEIFLSDEYPDELFEWTVK